jgi:hypothetical protein
MDPNAQQLMKCILFSESLSSAVNRIIIKISRVTFLYSMVAADPCVKLKKTEDIYIY